MSFSLLLCIETIQNQLKDDEKAIIVIKNFNKKVMEYAYSKSRLFKNEYAAIELLSKELLRFHCYTDTFNLFEAYYEAYLEYDYDDLGVYTIDDRHCIYYDFDLKLYINKQKVVPYIVCNYSFFVSSISSYWKGVYKRDFHLKTLRKEYSFDADEIIEFKHINNFYKYRKNKKNIRYKMAFNFYKKQSNIFRKLWLTVSNLF